MVSVSSESVKVFPARLRLRLNCDFDQVVVRTFHLVMKPLSSDEVVALILGLNRMTLSVCTLPLYL